MHAELLPGRSAVGGGAAPDAALATTLIALTHRDLTDTELEQKLRTADPPIITRIENGKVLIDLRTVTETEEAQITEALVRTTWR